MSESSDPENYSPLSPYDVVHREFIKAIGAMPVMVKKTPRAKPIQATLNQIDSPPLLKIFDDAVDRSMKAIREEFCPSPHTMSMLYAVAATQFEALIYATSSVFSKKPLNPDEPILVNPEILSNICIELPNYYAVPESGFYQDLKLLTPLYQAAHDPMPARSIVTPAGYDHIIAKGGTGRGWLGNRLRGEDVGDHPEVETEKRITNILKLMHTHQHELFRAPPKSDQSKEAKELRDQVRPKAMLIAKVAKWLLEKENEQTVKDPSNQQHELSPRANANLLMEAILYARDTLDMEELKSHLDPNGSHFKKSYEATVAANAKPDGAVSNAQHFGAFPAQSKMQIPPIARQ